MRESTGPGGTGGHRWYEVRTKNLKVRPATPGVSFLAGGEVLDRVRINMVKLSRSQQPGTCTEKLVSFSYVGSFIVMEVQLWRKRQRLTQRY